MKYILGFFIALSVTLAGFAAQDDEQTKNPVPIIKGEYGDHTKIQPRSIVRVPMTCMQAGGQVQICFTEDLGEVEVIVTSLTTGEQWFAVGNASNVITVQASDEAGDYVVQIYAGSNAWYGCYTIY